MTRIVSLAVFCSTAAVVSAGRGIPTPDITVGLNVGHDTNSGTMGGVIPKAKWESDVVTITDGVDVQGGLDIAVTDFSPKGGVESVVTQSNVWGKLRALVPGVGVINVRGDMDPNARDVVDLNIQATAFDTGIQVVGAADLNSPSVAVDRIQVTKSIDALGGSISLNPKYDVSSSTPDLTVGYSIGDMSFKVDADSRKLTVAHSFAGGNKVTPSVTASGDFSLSYSRPLLEGGRLTTTWKPDDAVKVQWTDGGWDASLTAPLDGYFQANSGIKVSMKRSLPIMEAGVIDFN
eukprot:CAMPEP_0113481298 /NCGR_PEP_ID=MMETSP0014_2-20120614/22337_1 /TAXON_ID=2857 /ORGANISM="Nitzschia sp." /LENGTH=290 /DNA_ID=CAMNT_0000374791 /DNA_START=96 /DNA_END=968 /DNA_ORIENTATION=- /assembly_acc=CAM_ASM_000159